MVWRGRPGHLLHCSRIWTDVRGAAVCELTPLRGGGRVKGRAATSSHKMFFVPLQHIELKAAILAAVPLSRAPSIDEGNPRRCRPSQALGRHHPLDRPEARPDALVDAVSLRLLVEEGPGELEPLGTVEQACVSYVLALVLSLAHEPKQTRPSYLHTPCDLDVDLPQLHSTTPAGDPKLTYLPRVRIAPVTHLSPKSTKRWGVASVLNVVYIER